MKKQSNKNKEKKSEQLIPKPGSLHGVIFSSINGKMITGQSMKWRASGGEMADDVDRGLSGIMWGWQDEAGNLGNTTLNLREAPQGGK